MKSPNVIEVYESPFILMSSSVRVEPGLRCRRVVLREIPNQFVTHVEYLRIDIVKQFRDGKHYDVVQFTNEAFEHGHYFPAARCGSREKALQEANDDFNARVVEMDGCSTRAVISPRRRSRAKAIVELAKDG